MQRQNSKGVKRRKSSVTQEDSHKEMSRFVQRNPADHEEGLVTFSTLTQGKAAPGRGRRGHGERAPYRVTAAPGRGKDRPRPPAHQETSQGPRQGLGNLYTRGYASTDLYRQEVPSPERGLLCSLMTPGGNRRGQQAEPLTKPSAGQTRQQAEGSLGDGDEEPERGGQGHDYL